MTTTQNTLGILKATALDRVTLSVKNLTESVNFYQTLFGFSLKQDQPEHRSQIIGNDTISLCILNPITQARKIKMKLSKAKALLFTLVPIFFYVSLMVFILYMSIYVTYWK
jgi:catechol-2,3-dioxygenase